MENLKIESRCLKLCYKFKASIRCMRAAFYRPDFKNFNVSFDQKTWPNFCLETRGQAFETLSRACETLGRVFEN